PPPRPPGHAPLRLRPGLRDSAAGADIGRDVRRREERDLASRPRGARAGGEAQAPRGGREPLNPREAARLIARAVVPRAGAWADLGAGEGTFTRALASL